MALSIATWTQKSTDLSPPPPSRGAPECPSSQPSPEDGERSRECSFRRHSFAGTTLFAEDVGIAKDATNLERYPSHANRRDDHGRHVEPEDERDEPFRAPARIKKSQSDAVAAALERARHAALACSPVRAVLPSTAPTSPLVVLQHEESPPAAIHAYDVHCSFHEQSGMHELQPLAVSTSSDSSTANPPLDPQTQDQHFVPIYSPYGYPAHFDPNYLNTPGEHLAESSNSPSPPGFFNALPPAGYSQSPYASHGPNFPIPSWPYSSSPPMDWEGSSWNPNHPSASTNSLPGGFSPYGTANPLAAPGVVDMNGNWIALDPVRAGWYGPGEYVPLDPRFDFERPLDLHEQQQVAYDLGLQYAMASASGNVALKNSTTGALHHMISQNELGMSMGEFHDPMNTGMAISLSTSSAGGGPAYVDLRTPMELLMDGFVLRRSGTCKFFDIQKVSRVDEPESSDGLTRRRDSDSSWTTISSSSGDAIVCRPRKFLIPRLTLFAVFVHYTAIRQSVGFRCLSTGEPVRHPHVRACAKLQIEYDIVKASSGGYQALNVCGIEGEVELL